MQPKETRKERWIRKLLNRYRLVILNEDTFEEQLYFRLSRLNVLIISILLVSLIAVGVFSVIAYTPIKEYIPGYASSQIRQQAIENYLQVDSLQFEYEQNLRYLNSIKSALKGEVELASLNRDSVLQDTFQRRLPETFRIEQDSILRAEVEREDKYNYFETENQSNFESFFPPVQGIVSNAFDAASRHFAVDIAVDEGAPVKAIATGTAILAEWTAETGYVLILKHPEDLLSVYKHNQALYVKQGDVVKAGQVIAAAGNTGELTTGWHLHFELWVEGYPINPEDVIDFTE